jgi:hypothetical protein
MMLEVCPMPLEAIALLGWMERDEALDFLRNTCVFDPALTEEQALALWEPYRQRVEALPARDIHSPHRKRLKPEESNWERQFLQSMRQKGVRVRSVIKVNIHELVVHQKRILVERSARYAAQLTDQNAWNRMALPVDVERFDVPVNMRVFKGGLKLEADIDVPDSEWLFQPIQCLNGEMHFKPGPAFRFVTATELENDRLLLWSGYHRSYAWATNAEPDGTECPTLVALTENTVAPPIVGIETPFDRLVRGLRPPVFADFFDERFFMHVRLPKKKFQMQIRADLAEIDDP